MERSKVSPGLFRLASGLFFFASVLGALNSSGWSAEKKAAGTKEATKKKSDGGAFQPSKKEPIFITSDWMEADRKKNTIIYKGRVVAIQADMTMRSDTLTAYYEPDMKQMREVVAEGKVNVTQGDRVATGSKAVFDGKNQTITLTGSPVVRQGNNEVSGNRIIFFMEEDRAVAESGGNQRIQAKIFPDEFEKADKGEGGPGKMK